MAVRGGLAALARRPGGLVEQTGWLFFLCALLSLVLTVPASVAAGSAAGALTTLVAAGALAASWRWRYVHSRTTAALDVLDAAAVLAFAAACPTPAVAFGFTFAALWPRALYGTTAGAVAYCLGLAGAMAASVPLWGVVSGHRGATEAGPVLGALPVLLLTMLVARHLALVLVAREQSQRRDAALVELGTALLGVTDREQAHVLAWQASTAVCAATPGLRVLVVCVRSDGLHVLGTAGPFVHAPSALPSCVLPGGVPATDEPVAVSSPPELAAAAGDDARWLALAVPGVPYAALLVGAPDGVGEDALVALRSMMNQVALALRAGEAHHDLARQASTDALTGLANRAAFHEALTRSAGSCALLFLDLDDFKGVNDGWGHAAGDDLLRQVAERMRSGVRPEDVCARLGGDEFAVVLADGDRDAAVGVATRLVALLAAPVVLSGRPTRVGVSVGVVGADPAHGLDAEQLLHRADVAMYAAKAGGKNRVHLFDPALLHVDAAERPCGQPGRPVSRSAPVG